MGTLTNDQIIEHANSLLLQIQRSRRDDYAGNKGQVCEFLREFGGKANAFLAEATRECNYGTNDNLSSVLVGFISFIKSGLRDAVSLERQTRLDMTADFLEQAETILDTKGLHPASAIMIMGAALEEFLRNWVEREAIDIGQYRPSIESFSQLLRSKELISKQDSKFITSWGGMRNSAAHGQWDEASNVDAAKAMLIGIQAFIKEHSIRV